MILSARDLFSVTRLDTDICIVGAGAAGITLACELMASKQKVLLLEAGERTLSAEAQQDLEGEIADGSLHSPPSMYRRRIFGGATSIWGGRCVPLDPLDLEPRPHVPLSGWPVTWEELRGCYERVQPYFDAGSFAYRATEALGGQSPSFIAGFSDPDIAADGLERFSPPIDFGKANENRLATSTNTCLLLGATALRLIAPDGPVAGLDAIFATGHRFTVHAKRYVLAMGGMETPRLLMASDTSRRNGLGNEGGALGRYYMCHLENTLGRLQLLPANRSIALDFERSLDGIYVRRKFSLSASAQLREELLNTTFRLHYPPIADPAHGNGILSAMYLVKDAVLPEYRRKLATIEIANRDRLRRDGRFWLAHARNVIRNTPDVGRFGAVWLRRRILARRKLPFVVIRSRDGSYPLDVNAEQIPNPESRILLSNRTDRYGIPMIRVDWRPTAQDFDSLVRAMRVTREAFARSGCARLEFDDDAIVDQVRDATPVGGHHLGTTRISGTPREGVVDSNCAVHGAPNLYIAGGAVFPTCGHANPTLTIAALTIRLADHLKKMMARDDRPVVLQSEVAD